MKKLILQITFLVLLLPAMTQAAVHVTGTITDSANNSPVPNHAVYISSDSSSGFVYYKTVYTNSSGIYADTVPAPGGTSGTLFIQTYDCNNYLHLATIYYTPSNLYFTQDFQICNSNSPCQAAFTYYPDSSNYLLIQFIDQSQGNIAAWYWSFGDPQSGVNNLSYLQNPTHQYLAPGNYTVCLIVVSADSSCYDTTCGVVIVGNNTSCQADFTHSPDSTDPLMIHFFDQSAGNIISWNYNFGDPPSGANNTSTLQNPTHTFSAPGTYNVCLTIMGADSTCYDITCKTVVVGNTAGCQAAFTYYPDNSLQNTIHFIDQSAGNIATWTWDFGDGFTQTVSYPASPNVSHTYPSSSLTYIACLYIQGFDSTCFDFTCDTISFNSGGGCQADFTYYPDSSNTNMIHFLDQSAGNIISWTWNFGDGSPAGTGQNPVHVYPAPGTYEVCLTIQGADSSCFDMTCQAVTVGNEPGCQAMFTYNSNPAFGAYAIQFIDQSTGNPQTWMWSFGDSTYSALQNPFHQYNGPGTYMVCLTITGNNCTSTYCQNVVVADSSAYHQVYGQVFEGNFPIQLGIAIIFSLDATLNYNPYIDISVIDSMGIYYFSLVPDGNYLIYAIPLDSNGYLPTYYGDVLNWEQASVIELGEPDNPYDIHLIQSGYMPQGPGSVSGQIYTGSLRSSYFDKMVMLLLNNDGQAISYGQVTASGSFDFSSMDYGTYYLHPELSGVTSENVQVVLTPEKPHVDVVMTFAGKNILAIKDEEPVMEAGTIYPNPMTDRFSLPLSLASGMNLQLDIFNQVGRMVLSTSRSQGSGHTSLSIPVTGLEAGIYTLRITSEKGTVITRKLIIAR